MRFLLLLLFVLGLSASVVACASRGPLQLDEPSQVLPVEANYQSQFNQPPPLRKGIPSALPQASQPPVLSWNSHSRKITWLYQNLGDYNQDGEANAADISQIATYFGASIPFDQQGLAQIADGDINGEVNLADITPIALNFGNRVDKYLLYSSGDESDVPAEPGTDNGPGAQLAATIFLADAEIIAGQQRELSKPISADTSDEYFWLRTVENNVEGLASNAVFVKAGAVAVVKGNPTTGAAPLRVSFDGSLSQGNGAVITNYRWDFDGDGVIDLDSGLSSVVEHVYSLPGAFVAKLTVTTSESSSPPATQPITVSNSAFVFTPWEETYIGGGVAGNFVITPRDLGETIEVEIATDNAIGLKAVFGALSYDPTSLRFIESYPSFEMSQQGELLSFDHIAPDSRVHIGQCMTLPQDKDGLFGDHLMATVVFIKEPEVAVEIERHVPLNSASAVTGLSASRLDRRLVWRYQNSGDNNQDGVVLASDLALLAYYWNRPGPFNHNSSLALADANGDNLISAADIPAITESYLQSISGFHVYGSASENDYPNEETAPNGAGTILLGYLPKRAGVGEPIHDRLRYEFLAPGSELPDYLWIRAVYEGNDGISSNLVEPSTEFFISPDWTDSDWDNVSGTGKTTHSSLQLGETGDGRTFSFIATTQPDGQGSMIDVATLTWQVLPGSSGTMPEPGVMIPRVPIAIGFMVATDSLGNRSNELYFFAGSAPGS